MNQALKITIRQTNGAASRVLYPFAIWHNQKTGQITINTPTGHHRFAADSVEAIEMLQSHLPFDSSPSGETHAAHA